MRRVKSKIPLIYILGMGSRFEASGTLDSAKSLFQGNKLEPNDGKTQVVKYVFET